jgi:hypothetical protein
MKRVAVSCCSLLALVALLGCEKKPDVPAASDAPAAQAAAPTPAAPEKAMAATATVDLEKIAVEEQFEKEVEAEVTPANFEQQLEALEKEIKAQ